MITLNKTIAISLLLFLAFFDMPYAYYKILKIIISGFCIYSVVKFKTEWMRWIFGGMAVLYNPILPITLGTKDDWLIVNIVTIAYIWFVFYIENKNKSKKKSK